MFTVLLALLEEKNILNNEEAKILAEKLGTSMLPSDYKEAQRLIKKILIKIK